MNADELTPLDRAASDAERAASVVVGTSSRALVWIGLAVLLLALGGLAAAGRGTGYAYGSVPPDVTAVAPSADLPSDPIKLKKFTAKLKTRQKQILAALEKKAPKGIYVVIDQTQNRIYVKRDEQTVIQAVCSAGSGMVLKDTQHGRKWVFDTPRGFFKVKSRQADPVWKKPDWAFVEEGRPIPKNDDERFDYGTLGEYAFYLGDGYMIHGTLYERLLGRSVTHGCIRVGREDLRKLWQLVQIGTPVYIY